MNVPLDLAALLSAVDAAPPVAAVDVVSAALARTFGATEVSFLIADFSGRSVTRLGRAGAVGATRILGDETARRVPLEGTPYGRALAGQTVEVIAEPPGARLYVPVTSRGDAVGVLELRLDAPPDDRTVADITLAAHALAYVLIANRRYTDLFEWGRRPVPLSLAAEIQHRLLPDSYACEADQFTLAAWLEPAGEVGGDTFDFSLDRGVLHLSISDAVGHLVEASLLATVLVGALRNARRGGAGLAEQARLANEALVEHSSTSQFVTGQLVRVDLRSGRALIVNAGHPPPMRVRGGRVESVALRAEPPFGTEAERVYEVQSLPLQRGDRLMFLTDGVLERNASVVDMESLLAAGRPLHPREAVQQLTRVVYDACGGVLPDDATVLCLDWHGERRPTAAPSDD